MFSGKTTELIRRVRRYQFANYRCLIIRYAKDDRYDTEKVATHDHQKIKAVSATELTPLIPTTKDVDVIAIDEGQFFPDITSFAETMADSQKIVLVAALDGTFQRVGFGGVLNLIPLAESVEKLTAVCMSCFRDAAFTKRLGKEKEVELIGGAERYMAVCRECHKLEAPVKRSPFKTLDNGCPTILPPPAQKRKLFTENNGTEEGIAAPVESKSMKQTQV